MDVKELKAQMVRKDKSVDDLCAALGISRTTWFRKVGGETQFTQAELGALRRELDLNDQMTITIFFNQRVS